MPAKKKQVTVPVPKDATEFTRLLNDCALLQLNKEENEAALNALLANTGKDLRASIELDEAVITARLGMLQAYAHLNREALFGKSKKSAETTQAEYGFADNPAALKLLSKEFTDETAIEALLQLGKPEFVRTKREIDRDAIKAALHEASEMEALPDEERPKDWKPKITATQIRMCGLKLQQGERFWIKPKRAAETEASKISTP